MTPARAASFQVITFSDRSSLYDVDEGRRSVIETTLRVGSGGVTNRCTGSEKRERASSAAPGSTRSLGFRHGRTPAARQVTAGIRAGCQGGALRHALADRGPESEDIRACRLEAGEWPRSPRHF